MNFDNYNDIKFYQINLDFFEFKDHKNNLSFAINHIIQHHKENFKSDFDLSYSEESFHLPPCHYTLFTFLEKERESNWKEFFPQELVGKSDFTIKSTSFVLFIEVNNRLLAVIGGKGIAVIKRFINPTFGLNLYEKIASPVDDIVHSQTSRGVSGNLTSEQITYRKEQKLQDVLMIGRVPKQLNLLLRNELKDSIFDFIDFDQTENIYLEIGSSFCIKWKINFDQLHNLAIKINEILGVVGTHALSRFERIVDQQYIANTLTPALLTQIRDDMVRLATPGSNLRLLLDTDFVHPSKLVLFYECDTYQAFYKGHRIPFFETRERQTLYTGILKSIYSIVSPTDQSEFSTKLLGVRIRGFVGNVKKTEAMFINHLTCELTIGSQPVFLIDDIWYRIKGDFIKSINDQCSQLIKRNIIAPSPLTRTWDTANQTESEYNLSYINDVNYFVFDKILSQNIELCDILYEAEDTVYLIHVKDGFDAKIRDLTNQVSIAASRLWEDLKSDRLFLQSIFKTFACKNHRSGLTFEEFLKKFISKEIVFVLAFASNTKGKTVLENMSSQKSNIAKFSIIQVFREQTSNYQLRVIEIQRDTDNSSVFDKLETATFA